MNLILEPVRTESDQYLLLLGYLGYGFYELDKPAVLDIMDHVGLGASVVGSQNKGAAGLRLLAKRSNP